MLHSHASDASDAAHGQEEVMFYYVWIMLYHVLSFSAMPAMLLWWYWRTVAFHSKANIIFWFRSLLIDRLTGSGGEVGIEVHEILIVTTKTIVRLPPRRSNCVSTTEERSFWRSNTPLGQKPTERLDSETGMWTLKLNRENRAGLWNRTVNSETERLDSEAEP